MWKWEVISPLAIKLPFSATSLDIVHETLLSWSLESIQKTNTKWEIAVHSVKILPAHLT